MAIVYPLVMPATPGFREAEMLANNIASLSQSPYSGAQQAYAWDGEFWEAAVDLPPMTRASAEAWIAFLVSLRGKYGTCVFGDPAGKTPQGSALGSPAVDGGSQTGTSLATVGWNASETNVLKAGDYIQIAKNYLASPRAFDAAAWTKNNCTITATNVAAPTGTTEAERVTPTVGQTSRHVRQNAAAPLQGVLNELYTFSCWLKSSAGDITSFDLRLSDDTGSTTNTVTLTSAWQLFSVTRGLATGATFLECLLGAPNGAGGDTLWDVWGASAFSPTQNSRLHKWLKDGSSDASLKLTGDIWPRLRESPPDFSRIITSSAVGTFRLSGNQGKWSISEAKHYGISFNLIEAF